MLRKAYVFPLVLQLCCLLPKHKYLVSLSRNTMKRMGNSVLIIQANKKASALDAWQEGKHIVLEHSARFSVAVD